jgi:hypothetical protein
MFISSRKYSKGHHHWKGDKEYVWFERVVKFLEEVLKIEISRQKDIAIVIILLYPAFGPSTGKKVKKEFNPNTKVNKLLGEEGMKIFKQAITLNNNEEMRDKFFKSKIIRDLWNKVVPKMKLNEFFKDKPNLKIKPTYNYITFIMESRYGLRMCPEWEAAFPAAI